MRFVRALEGRVTVELTAEECEVISSGCRDGSTREDRSGDLSVAFEAFALVGRLSVVEAV